MGKIHDAIQKSATWNQNFKQLSWRVDVKTASKSVVSVLFYMIMLLLSNIPNFAVRVPHFYQIKSSILKIENVTQKAELNEPTAVFELSTAAGHKNANSDGKTVRERTEETYIYSITPPDIP
jgi:hypothetical protein